MAAIIPEVFYGNISGEEFGALYPELQRKSLGIRVFYFSEASTSLRGTASNCDHPQFHSSQWEREMEGGGRLEAGTTVALSQYGVKGDAQQRYTLTIRWDCGFEKVYTEPELKSIRVFDLGPTGETVLCQERHSGSNLQITNVFVPLELSFLEKCP